MKFQILVKGEPVEYDINRTTPVKEGDWTSRLALVSTGTDRYLGIVSPEDDEAVGERKPFLLFLALRYYAESRIVPGPNNTVQHAIIPRIAIPYDGLGVVQEVLIAQYANIIHVCKQSDEFQNAMYSMYLDYFDPKRVQDAPAPKLVI